MVEDKFENGLTEISKDQLENVSGGGYKLLLALLTPQLGSDTDPPPPK